MFYYYNPLQTKSGDILPDYLVRLLDASGNEVDIYADNSGTPIVTVSGVVNAAKADDLGMVRFWVPNGTYDIAIYDTTDTFKGREESIPMFDASGVYTDLSADTGASLVGSAGGDTVQEKLDAFQPTVDVVSDISAITSFDTTKERVIIGTATPSADNSAVLIARDIVTALGFDHAVRDESTFLSTGDSAYASFDAIPTFVTNGGVKYNHGYGFQARPLMAATNGMDLFAGLSTQMRVSAGTVDRLFHVHIASLAKTGGTVSAHVGLYISPLTGGAGTNWAIYQESVSNPSYFAAKVRVDNAVATSSVTANATLVEFPEGGGTALIGKRGAAELGALQAFADGAGTPKSLALQPDGATLLVGASIPASGATLEVVGTVTATGTIKAPANRIEGQDVVATGTWTNTVADGVLLTGSRGASLYGAVQAFGSSAPKGLAIQPDGGQVLVNATSPVTGEAFEVVGTIGTSESYRVDGVKVVGNQGAAVADATDAASAITQLNALLARCRAHGLIAT